jgi:protein ImuA
MASLQPDIIHQLRQEILLRQGFRPPSAATVEMGLGPVEGAFPHGVFPSGAMHEVLSEGAEETAAAKGFMAALMGPLMRRGGAVIWVSGERRVFPPGLAAFGVDGQRVIHVTARKEKSALWAIEEALKCEGLAAVVGEVREVGAIASRRLQLAVEQSRVTGFVLRENPRNREAIAAVARWRVSGVSGSVFADAMAVEGGVMPGVGFPRWNIELSRIRNGRPGNWVMEWRAGRFHHVQHAVGVQHAVCVQHAVGVEDGVGAGAGVELVERRRQTG